MPSTFTRCECHGVGMCQNGAMGMAKHGRSFIDILEHYYQNVSVETIY